MSRTPKEGLDYFPLVTRFEDKVELLIAEFGSRAVGIIMSLYQKIYSNSYYVKWDDDILMLFARYLNEEKTVINDVINRCFDREIFDKKKYEKHGILTSRGIQKQYLKVCKDSRRTKVVMIKEFCLINNNCDEFKSIITEFISINDENIPINDSENTQSKGKESIVNNTLSENGFSDDSLQMELTNYMIKRIVENYPSAKIPDTPAKLQKWCLTFDRIIRIDEKTKDEIQEIMEWVYQDEFWCDQIRSPAKLREKWDTLYLRMRKKNRVEPEKLSIYDRQL